MNLSRPLRAVSLGVSVALALSSFPRTAVRAADPASPGAGWTEVTRTDKVVVYGRDHAGSSVRELRGIGTIDAPNWVVKNVIDDGDHYTEFMPNTLESKVLSRDPAHHVAVAYAKLSAPLISPRDYTLLIHDESHAEPDGTVVYKARWEPAPAGTGPAEKSGVTRVKVNEGYWLLESIDNGQKTRATYQLYTDGGGNLPAFVLNQASKRRIGDVYEAVEQRAAKPQYRKAKPVYP